MAALRYEEEEELQMHGSEGGQSSSVGGISAEAAGDIPSWQQWPQMPTPTTPTTTPTAAAVAVAAVAAVLRPSKSLLSDIMAALVKLDRYKIFANPVTEAVAPGYFKVVKNPMDLGTMQTKTLSPHGYLSLAALEKDLCTTLKNALLYNPKGSPVRMVSICIFTHTLCVHCM